jgi:hypothetical protein
LIVWSTIGNRPEFGDELKAVGSNFINATQRRQSAR